MLLELLMGTSLLFYFLVGAAWVSSRQVLVLLLFLPKGIRWYLVCSFQVREVSVTKFYSLKYVPLLSRQRYTLEPAKVHTLAAWVTDCPSLALTCRDRPININMSSYTPALGQLYPSTTETD